MMHPSICSLRFLGLLLLTSIASIGHAEAAEGPKWQPYFTAGGKLGNQRDIAETQLFLPLAQNENSLIFGYARFRADRTDDLEGNIGVGYRRIVQNRWIAGGYAFFDYRRTTHHNAFRQLTLGGEILNENWDLRANVYLPERDKKLVSRATSTALVGTQIFIDTQTSREQALPGFDIELGRRIPVFNDDRRELRLFLAGYHFENDDFGNISGVRGRAQLAFSDLPLLGENATLRLHGETQYDDVREASHSVGAELIIPLRFGKRKRKRLSPLERRMTNPIVRDIDIVSGETISTLQEPARAVVNGQAHDEVHVISASNGGDLEDQFATLNDNTLVILNHESPITLENTLVLKPGQSLVGGSMSLPLSDDYNNVAVFNAGSDSNPTLVRGDELFGASQPIIELATDGNHTIRNLSFTNQNDTSGGLEPMIANNGNAVRSLTLSNVSSTGRVVVDITEGSTMVNVTGSHIHGLDLRTRNDSSMTISMTGNTFDRMLTQAALFGQNITASVFIEALDTSSIVVTDASNNVIRDENPKITGRAALGLGFLNSSSTDMIIERIVDNEIFRMDMAEWDAGAILAQGHGGDLLRFNQIHSNTADGEFVTLGSRINIGLDGVTADIAGFEAANDGLIFEDFGDNLFTNTVP